MIAPYNGANTAAGHSSGPAYRRFQRSAQTFDFTSGATNQNESTSQSALNRTLAAHIGGRDVGNHVTPQLMQQIGLGGAQAMGGAVPGTGFAGMAGGLAGVAGMAGAGQLHKMHALDDHNEEFVHAAPHFNWPVRPNPATEYRHVFYNPISRKECREKNAQHGHPPEHWDSHTPNNNRPLDCDEHMWQQALLNKPANPEYEYELQQVVGFGALHARMEQRQKRVMEMHEALQEVERRITRMTDIHCKHESDSREHRHRQQGISHQILRVMGKVDRLQSERLRIPWTAHEDEVSSRLRLMTRELQHPAHPVNALDTLGPRVRLAASTSNDRKARQAAEMTLSKTDLQTIAGVLAEQRKGLEFLRNTLQTDSRHLALMLKMKREAALRHNPGSQLAAPQQAWN